MYICPKLNVLVLKKVLVLKYFESTAARLCSEIVVGTIYGEGYNLLSSLSCSSGI